MKINQKIVHKIEGEATLKIYGEKRVDFVEIEFYNFRGIENYLVNRPVLDALVINPRICGICGHSHLFATVRAIENSINAKVSKKAEILREITVGLEIVQNHIKWFYITFFPTLIKDRSYILKALNFSQLISKTIALISGQYPHNAYMLPGGVTCDITNVELLKLKSFLKEIKNRYEEEIIDMNLYSKDIEKFFNLFPKEVGKSENDFLVLGDNLYFKNNGKSEFVKEKNHNVFYKDNFVEVGPLARNHNNKKIKELLNKYGKSVYVRVISRMYEGLLVLKYLLKIVKNIDLCEPSFIENKMIDSKGESIIEAPRGSLIHQIEIKDSKIKSYNIIVPTQFNLSSSKDKNILSPSQSAIIGEERKYIDTIFKCFDICAVCFTH